MNNKKLIVIGEDAVGMTAASKVRREQFDGEKQACPKKEKTTTLNIN